MLRYQVYQTLSADNIDHDHIESAIAVRCSRVLSLESDILSGDSLIENFESMQNISQMNFYNRISTRESPS